MAGKRPTFVIEDGIYECQKEFCRRMKDKGKVSSATEIAKMIAKRLSTDPKDEIDRVKKWVSGKSGPQRIEEVEVLADYFGCEIRELLMLVDRKEINMKNMISDTERAVARGLYGELCDLIQDLDWGVTLPLGSDEYYIEQSKQKQRDAFYEKYANSMEHHFFNAEEARCYYIQMIRKTALDLPAKMRADLIDFVNDCFVRTDYDEASDTYSYEVFGAPFYEDYLQGNKIEDTIENQYKYKVILKTRLEKKLDDIFQNYIRI